jgi:hypothetical protein
VGPYRGIAQDEHEGVCPWCQRIVRYETGAETVVCGCGARSAIALVKPPQVALQRRPHKPRRSDGGAGSTDTNGAWAVVEIVGGLLELLFALF